MAYEGLRAGEQINKHFEELELAIFHEKTIPELLPYREDLIDKIDKLIVEQVSTSLRLCSPIQHYLCLTCRKKS